MSLPRPVATGLMVFAVVVVALMGILIIARSQMTRSERDALPQSTEVVVLDRATVHFVCHGSVGLYEFKHRIDVVPDHEACR